jgi:phosphatidylglycerol:prolipoprotein diacylglycerol transferase
MSRERGAQASTLSGVLVQINVLGLSLKTFGIVFALVFVAVGAILARRLKELGKPVDYAYEMAFAALVGGLVGARLYYVVQNYSQVKNDLVGSLFSGSGLVWYGGLIGGALGVMGWAKWREMLNLGLFDLCAVPLAMGYAIGRIGCQVAGDGDYGNPSSLPWAMGYPHGTVPTPPGVRVQPAPIYETLAMGLIAWWLWRMRDRFRPGALFSFYLVLSGAERLLVEFVRRNHRVIAGLSDAQIESIALMLAGLGWLVWLNRRGGLERAGGSGAALAGT